MTKFTADVTDQDALDAIASEKQRIVDAGGQAFTDDEYASDFLTQQHKLLRPGQISADLNKAIEAAKAGDATALKAVADVIATAAQAAKVDPAPQPEPAIPANPV